MQGISLWPVALWLLGFFSPLFALQKGGVALRRNRTLRLSEEEIALQERARLSWGDKMHLSWGEWARQALQEAAEDQLALHSRLKDERRKRELMRQEIGRW